MIKMQILLLKRMKKIPGCHQLYIYRMCIRKKQFQKNIMIIIELLKLSLSKFLINILFYRFFILEKTFSIPFSVLSKTEFITAMSITANAIKRTITNELFLDTIFLKAK